MRNNYLIRDDEALALTARVLDTSVLRIFELAYQEWHGQAPRPCDLERAFEGYVFEGQTPCWVRAFTRNTLQLCEEAGLALPVTQSVQNVTLRVSQAEMLALLGFGVVCLVWLAGLI